MSEADNRPGDVWITVNSYGDAPAKYYQDFFQSTMSFDGPHGAAKLEARFNLTAYVRGMIGAALSEKPQDITVACKCGWQGRQSKLVCGLCPTCGEQFEAIP